MVAVTITAEREQILAEMEEVEAAWEHPPELEDGVHYPCLFYLLDRFALMLDAAVDVIRSDSLVPYSYLEVGCGIGTKAAYAMRAYQLLTCGIDRLPRYVGEAVKLGVGAEVADAEQYGFYGDFGIVYVNHPFMDRDAEAALERKIQAEMLPGAVLICVNTPHFPQGWEPVYKPPVWPLHGAWRKPG